MPMRFDTYREDDGEPRSATCTRCGAEDLEWVDCGSAGWKLYEGMKLHRCQNAAKANEFEEVNR